MARQRSDLRPVLAAGAVTLLALLLRFLAARQSLGGDELFSLEVAFRPTLGDVIDGVRGPLEITPPGFFVFAWAFSKLGDPTYWLKAPSVLAGALTVPVIYAIGARTVGRWAGVIGGVLFAISPYAVFYGSEARAYALTGLCVALSTLVLLIALERGRWPWWVAFGAAVAASMYAHYIAAFPLLVEVAWALWYHRDRWRPIVFACIGAAVLYIPWIPGLLDDRTSPYQHAISRVWPFTLNYVGTAIGQWLTGVPTWRAAKVPGPGALVLLVVGVLVLAGGLWLVRNRLPRRLADARPAHRPRAVRAGAGGDLVAVRAQRVRSPQLRGLAAGVDAARRRRGAGGAAGGGDRGGGVPGHRAGHRHRPHLRRLHAPAVPGRRELPERPRGAGPAGARGRLLRPRGAGGAPAPGAAGLPHGLQQRLDRPGPGPDRAGALRAQAVRGGAGGRGRPPHRAAVARVLGPPDDDAAGVPHRLDAPLRRRVGDLAAEERRPG